MFELIDNLKSEIVNKTYYDEGLILYTDQNSEDRFANQQLSHNDWVKNFDKCSSILVRGLETHSPHKDKYFSLYKDIKFDDLHLFFNIKGGVSFREHTDPKTVYLHVIKGFKRVHMLNSVFTVEEGGYIIIQKGTLHKIESTPDTWAISVGIDN
jgi:ribosomal protein L16 Arg81 hydroxylase